jgi:hypothetical protein
VIKFFKKLSLRTQLFIGIAVATLLVLLAFAVSGKIDIRPILKYELSKAKAQREIEYLNQHAEENVDKIKDLDKKEDAIRSKIGKIESQEIPKSVSVTELNKFFKERGF